MPGVCPQPFHLRTLRAFHLIHPSFDLFSLLVFEQKKKQDKTKQKLQREQSREEETLPPSFVRAAGSTASQMLHLNEVWGVM